MPPAWECCHDQDRAAVKIFWRVNCGSKGGSERQGPEDPADWFIYDFEVRQFFFFFLRLKN